MICKIDFMTHLLVTLHSLKNISLFIPSLSDSGDKIWTCVLTSWSY